MGLFTRDEFRLRGDAARVVVFEDSGRKSYNMEVVGESYRKPTLARSYANHGEGPVPAILKPEPRNRYDRNAVSVHLPEGLVGYLAKADARNWQHRIIAAWRREGCPIAVNARIKRGGSGRDIGYGVWLCWPKDFDRR